MPIQNLSDDARAKVLSDALRIKSDASHLSTMAYNLIDAIQNSFPTGTLPYSTFMDMVSQIKKSSTDLSLSCTILKGQAREEEKRIEQELELKNQEHSETEPLPELPDLPDMTEN